MEGGNDARSDGIAVGLDLCGARVYAAFVAVARVSGLELWHRRSEDEGAIRMHQPSSVTSSHHVSVGTSKTRFIV